MRVAPRRGEALSLPWRAFLGSTLLGLISHSLLAEDAQARKLPPRVESVLRWLPEDTETLIVARSVTLPAEPKLGELVNWQDFGVSLATGDLSLVAGGKLLKPLQGRKLEYVIHGAMNFESVSSFGSLRSESCAILVFETDLGDAVKVWNESLRKDAKAVRTLVGREVFVFPSTTTMEPWVKQTKWQGTYLVLLKPNTLLCATSDRYLESVLHRVNGSPKARAFPDHLSEWKQVDLDAPVWLLRHLPNVNQRINTVGLTASFIRNSFRVVYLPKPGSNQNLLQIKARWLPKQELDDLKIPDPLKIERQLDGTVVVSSVGTSNDEAAPWLGFQLYWLQGHPLVATDN